MWIFLLVFLTLLASVWSYLWISLIPPFHLTALSISFWATVWIVSFASQLVRWLFYTREDANPHLLWYTYFFIGLVSHLAFYCVLKDIAFLLIDTGAEADKIEAYLNLIAAGLCLGLNLWGTQTAMAGPIVREAKLMVPQWPKEKQLRIVQISDLS